MERETLTNLQCSLVDLKKTIHTLNTTLPPPPPPPPQYPSPAMYVMFVDTNVYL